MIWLTWRQFRAQAITAAAALAAFAILLAATGSHLSGMYDGSRLATCHGGTCAGLASTFLSNLPPGAVSPWCPAAATRSCISSASWSSSSRPWSPGSSGVHR